MRQTFNPTMYSILKHSTLLKAPFISLIFGGFAASQLFANPPQVQSPTFGSGTSFPLSAGSSFPVTMILVHDAGTTIVVTFSLENRSTGGSIPLGTQQFNTFQGAVTTLTMPNGCFTPATGWQLYATAQGQQSFGSFSYSSNSVSIFQNPAEMKFEPITSGTFLVIAKSSAASSDGNNFTINDSLWLRVFPANDGCAPSAGFQIVATVDDTSAPGSAELDGGSFSDLNFQIPPLSSGSHTVSFSLLSPSGTTLDTVSKSFVVAGPPTIDQQPKNQTVVVGDPTTFTISASGTPSPSYQWRLNDKPIPDATGSSYHIDAAQLSDSGQYSCIVSNSAGSDTSDEVTLTVNSIAPAKISSVSLTAPDGIQLMVTSQPGRKNVIESSNDLNHWAPVSTNITPSGTFTVSIPIETNQNLQYYRVRTQ